MFNCRLNFRCVHNMMALYMIYFRYKREEKNNTHLYFSGFSLSMVKFCRFKFRLTSRSSRLAAKVSGV